MRFRLPARAEPWLHALADLVFPPRCAACQARLHPGTSGYPGFCSDCGETLVPLTPPSCLICAEPFPSASPAEFSCPTCQGKPQPFEFATSGWLLRGALREAVHRFKYQSHLPLRGTLARYLRDALDDPRIAGEPDWILVPVPLHRKRRRERQFNQSGELASRLSRLTGLPCAAALKRARYTTPQVRLRHRERQRNLKGAFAVMPPARGEPSLTGRNVLLVDDVFTSGATARECARTLRSQADPARVAVITLARG